MRLPVIIIKDCWEYNIIELELLTDRHTDRQSYFIRPVNNIHVRQQHNYILYTIGKASFDIIE